MFYRKKKYGLIDSIKKYLFCEYKYKKILLKRIADNYVSVSHFYKLIRENNLDSNFGKVIEFKNYKEIKTSRGDVLLISGDIICGFECLKISSSILSILNNIKNENVE